MVVLLFQSIYTFLFCVGVSMQFHYSGFYYFSTELMRVSPSATFDIELSVIIASLVFFQWTGILPVRDLIRKCHWYFTSGLVFYQWDSSFIKRGKAKYKNSIAACLTVILHFLLVFHLATICRSLLVICFPWFIYVYLFYFLSSRIPLVLRYFIWLYI